MKMRCDEVMAKNNGYVWDPRKICDHPEAILEISNVFGIDKPETIHATDLIDESGHSVTWKLDDSYTTLDARQTFFIVYF